MKKLFTVLSILAASAITGLAQYTNVSPAEGKIDMDSNESGLMSIEFRLPDGSQPNNQDVKFATLTYNGVVISKVPSTNSKLIKYDNFMNFVWNVSFFPSRNPLVRQVGEYKVTLDEGFFLVGEDKTPAEALERTYYIELPNITVTPAEGVVSSIQDFTVTFGDFKSITRNEEHPITVFNIYGETKEDGTIIEYTPLEDIQGNSVDLALLDEIKSQGSWRLEIPEGAFVGELEDGTTMDCPAVNETYVIPNHSAGPIRPSLPEGDIAAFPGVIRLNVAWGKDVRNVNTNGGNYIYPVDEYGNYGEPVARYQASLNQLSPTVVDRSVVLLTNTAGETIDDKFVPADFTPAPGNYDLVTSEMLFNITDDPKYQSSYVFHYTVLPSDVNCIITPDPDTIQNSLESFTITFPEADDIKLVNTEANWMSSDISSYLFYPHAIQEGSKSVTFYTQLPIQEAGKYTFKPNATAVQVDGKFVSIAPSYTIDPDYSGVNEIYEISNFDVYSIDGQLVKKNATDLSGLNKGLYIAKGKKILVK